jgi:membrane fusion protein, multidrug efflux system
MKLSSRSLSLITVLLLFTTVAAAVLWRLRGGEGGGGGGSGVASASPAGVAGGPSLVPPGVGTEFSTDAPNPVTGGEVRLDTLWIRVAAAGSAEAMRRTSIAPQVPGLVTGLPVRESRAVARGELLVQVDTMEYAMAVASARSGLVQAQATFRELTLFDADDTSLTAEAREERQRFARARAQLDQREVDLRRAELDLERSSIRAPFPGYVADLEVVEGEYVTTGQRLMVLVDIHPIKVEVNVLEREVANIGPGRRAVVTFSAFPDERFEGRVETINPILSAERTARVTVLLDNPGGRIKPGMYASVNLEAQAIPDRVLVPRSAILERDSRTMLFVFEEGRAKWRYVTTGRENSEWVEILENPETDIVRPGEIVLTNGHQYLFHEAPIRLVENVTAEGGRPGR